MARDPTERSLLALFRLVLGPRSYTIAAIASATGERFREPMSSKACSDHSSDWVDGIAERFDVENAVARQIEMQSDPSAHLERARGPCASADVGDESFALGMPLMFMAPGLSMR